MPEVTSTSRMSVTERFDWAGARKGVREFIPGSCSGSGRRMRLWRRLRERRKMRRPMRRERMARADRTAITATSEVEIR